MALLVMKFGGTSVGNAAAIEALAGIVREQSAVWKRMVVIVSAMSGVTDMLIQGAQTAITDGAHYLELSARVREKHAATLTELLGPDERAEAAAVRAEVERLIGEFELLCHCVHVLGEASPRALDAISSLGERMSVRVIAAALNARGLPAAAVDATEFVITTAHFGSAIPLQEQTRLRTQAQLGPLLDAGVVPIVTGYIGATEGGATTTLGRGGSDYSGAIIGAALDADEVAIYTDVDGVMTTDPRMVQSARVIPTLSYAEMGELAYFGAKVLHPRTIRPIVERGIALRIRNTFNPMHPGTLVLQESVQYGQPVKAVSAIRNMSLITVEGRGMIGVPGIAARTFGAVASVGANVLMISQASSEQSICFIVQTSAAPAVMGAIEEALVQELARRDVDRIVVHDGVGIITAVGAGMRETPGVASRVFEALGQQNINVIAIAQGSSECSISMVIDQEDIDAAVRAIHTLIMQYHAEQKTRRNGTNVRSRVE